MAKRKNARSGGELRRSCGTMAAHMLLLEQHPAFRASQMRLEGATDRRRQTAQRVGKPKIVTIKTVVNVVYNTDEQNVSMTQINSQIAALNKDFRATNPDRTQTPAAVEGAGHRFADPVQAGQGDAHHDLQGELLPRRRREAGDRAAASRRSTRRRT